MRIEMKQPSRGGGRWCIIFHHKVDYVMTLDNCNRQQIHRVDESWLTLQTEQLPAAAVVVAEIGELNCNVTI